MGDEKYYSLEDVSNELKVAYLTVYRWVQDGKLQAHQIGKQYRIAKEDFDAFVDSRKKSTTSPTLQELSKDQLIGMVKQLKRQKKFGLIWEDKPEDVAEQCKKELPVLEEVVKKAINKQSNAATNLIIEGDNYHSLSVLNYTHNQKVDVIYIDPPYNTGNQSWKYNNNYVDKDDPWKHSKWLSMMYKRLSLAKNLLKSNGSLVIAIDDYEVHHLGLLLEEMFPNYERNLVIVEHHPQGAGSNTISRTHEYAFICSPSGLGFTGRVIRDEEGSWSLKRSGQGENNWRKNRPKQFYAVIVDQKTRQVVGVGSEIPKEERNYPTGETKDGCIQIYPIDKEGKERCWRYNRSTMQKLIESNLIGYSPKGALTVKKEIVSQAPIFSVWSDSKYNAGTHGSSLLTKIMGTTNTFQYPKSIWTVVDMLKPLHSNKNAIILDFFAGSGTTGHAVMLLNKEDGGNRQFILCTNNENGIAEDVCYPRIEKVIGGVEGLPEVTGIPANLRYFKTAFVKKSTVSDDTRNSLVRRSAEMICVRENTFEKVVDKSDFKIYRDTDHVTGILFDLNSVEAFKAELVKQKLPAHIYVFSLSNDTYDDDFADLGLEHELCPIPESILEVYRKLFRSKKR